MPLTPEHQRMLEELGIGTSNSVAYANFTACNADLNAAVITRKLQEAKALADDAKKYSIDTLAARGKSIQLDDVTGREHFSYAWDASHNEYVITYKISGAIKIPKIHPNGNLIFPAKYIYPNLSGNPGEIRIVTFEANNAMQFEDIVGRCEALWKNVAPNLCTSISAKNEFINNQNILNAFDELKKDIESVMFTSKGNAKIKFIKRIMQNFLATLAIESTLPLKDPALIDKLQSILQDKINEISRLEDVVSSNKMRGLYVKVFPQVTSDNKNANNIYMRESLLAMSNVSSNYRTGIGQTLSNWFKVKNTSLRLVWDAGNNCSIHAKTESVDGYRSSSFDILDKKPGAEKDKALSEIAERTLRIKACDEIISKLVAGEQMPKNKTIVVNTAVITLLSPILQRGGFIAKTLAWLAKTFKQNKIAKTLQEANELSQLASTKKSMDYLFPKRLRAGAKPKTDADIFIPLTDLEGKKPPIKFDADDIEYIISALPATVTAAEKTRYRSQLRQIVISHSNLSLNFPSNLIAKKHAGDFDVFNFNRTQYNLIGVKMLNTKIFAYLKENFPESEKAQEFLKDLFRQYNQKNAKFKNTQDVIAEINSLIANKNIKKREFSALLQMIDSYVIVQNELQRLNSSDSRVIDSNIAAVHARKLSSMLGFEPHTTCKSGNDRTGVSFAFEQSYLADITSSSVYNSLAYGAGPHVTACNVVGAGYTALQIDQNLLEGLDTRTIELLQTKRREGQLAGDIYFCSDAIKATMEQYGFDTKKSNPNHRSSTKNPGSKLNAFNTPKAPVMFNNHDNSSRQLQSSGGNEELSGLSMPPPPIPRQSRSNSDFSDDGSSGQPLPPPPIPRRGSRTPDL